MSKYLSNTSKVFCLVFLVVISSCGENGPIKKIRKLNYRKIFERVKRDTVVQQSDTSNIFDNDEFDPTKDSVGKLLSLIEKDLTEDSLQLEKTGVSDTSILHKPAVLDTLVTTNTPNQVVKDSFSNDITKIATSEVKSLKYNLDQLKHAPPVAADSLKNKKQINARVWARVSKKQQLMQLYIDGQLVDSFKVSTGDKKHETPAFDLRPSGPIFTKYTSKKFPGGNYNGLGNMPYVVFIKGGYAIHGTTEGNIPKLGKKASHGCIRLHPDNAKIFNEIVKIVGLENTWITITED